MEASGVEPLDPLNQTKVSLETLIHIGAGMCSNRIHFMDALRETDHLNEAKVSGTHYLRRIN